MCYKTMAKVLWNTHLILSVLMLHRSPDGARNVEEATSKQLFVYKVEKTRFASADDHVMFRAALKDYPMLPLWLKLHQTNHSSDAFLYGIPGSGDASQDVLVIEIVAVNVESYDTARRKLRLRVIGDSPRAATQMQEVQLHIENKNLEDLLQPPTLLDLLDRIKDFSVWPNAGADLRVTDVKKMEEGDSDSVILKVASTAPHSAALLGVLSRKQRESWCEDGGGGDGVPAGAVSTDAVFAPEFLIDWCMLELTTLLPPGEMETASKQLHPIALEDEIGFHPPISRHPPRDFFWVVFLTLVVPCAALLFVVISFACIVFGFREGQEKRNRKTTEEDLQHYKNINRTSDSLRYAADHRDTPQPLTTSPGVPVQPASFRNDGLNAGSAPPPYQGSIGTSETLPLTRNTDSRHY